MTGQTQSLSGRQQDAVGHHLIVTVADQLVGIPVGTVRDVFKPDRIAPVPLTGPEIAGVLNLRGRILTAFDLRRRLGLAAAPQDPGLAVGIELRGEAYALLVDGVGEVLALSAATFAPNPAHLAERWSAVSAGVHRLEHALVVVLRVEELVHAGAA